MLKRLLALLAALCMVLVCAACNADTDKKSKKDKDDETVTEDNGADTGEEGNGNEGSGEIVVSSELTTLTAVQPGDAVCFGGVLSYRDGTYAVQSLDGSYSSGYVFPSAYTVGDFFVVKTAQPTATDDFAGINSQGVIDGNGNVIIPTKYAEVSQIGNGTRFFMVITATAIAQDTSDIAIALDQRSFSNVSVEGKILYSGTVEVFDAKLGVVVPGIKSGNQDDFGATSANNSYVSHRGEAYNGNGKLKQDLFDDGTYFDYDAWVIRDENGAVVCNWPEGYESPEQLVGGAYVADASGCQAIAVIDMTGTPLCTVEGGSWVTADGGYFLIRAGEEWVVVDSNGVEVYRGSDVQYDGTIAKQVNGTWMFYSFVDRDFTIKGGRVCQWLVTVEKNGVKSLVDVRTNVTLASGHRDYSVLSDNNGGVRTQDGYALIRATGEIDAMTFLYAYVK